MIWLRVWQPMDWKPRIACCQHLSVRCYFISAISLILCSITTATSGRGSFNTLVLIGKALYFSYWNLNRSFDWIFTLWALISGLLSYDEQVLISALLFSFLDLFLLFIILSGDFFFVKVLFAQNDARYDSEDYKNHYWNHYRYHNNWGTGFLLLQPFFLFLRAGNIMQDKAKMLNTSIIKPAVNANKTGGLFKFYWLRKLWSCTDQQGIFHAIVFKLNALNTFQVVPHINTRRMSLDRRLFITARSELWGTRGIRQDVIFGIRSAHYEPERVEVSLIIEARPCMQRDWLRVKLFEDLFLPVECYDIKIITFRKHILSLEALFFYLNGWTCQTKCAKSG